ncbi:uncharacterized protein NECHADRAFT_50453 [Fusarium vanettenii 77-13-4]|uniref:Uncharacterized protein n=1 Tax=Fusarium vanettenii (strain ATCC MYA-4622 / CBS 123669 / FGSC 9596 / NRRL 45880 / 77-13-4) TaxID=660122 RepID=C7ZNS6_FUSV7|nr:uncharacterized protein NECHADRAFT_50453 [Fusarium vanettenii 77-13-4]EEU34245.1 hypothetical protein NECHADRAFT_50453 [Fusarium vanettenii 77-13-4]
MGTRPQSSWRSLLSFFSVALFSLLLLLYLGPSRNSGQDLRVPVTERDLHDDAVTNLTKRATATYQAASEKGAKLHCLLAMSKEDVEAADGGKYKEPAKWLQKWGIEDSQGWVTEAEEGEEGADKNAPYWGDYLDAAFSSLDISKSDAHNVHWIHLSDAEIFPDPEEFEGTAEQGVRSGAYFTNSYILDPGVIIADNNYAVVPALNDNFPGWEKIFTTTHIQRSQWSDAAWMQWTKTCDWFGGDRTKIKYIIRSRITNKTTLSLIFEALISKYGGFPTIGKWDDRLTLDVATNPGEFHAVLASPNGAGVAYILMNHKSTLGIKTVNKVEIFVPNIPYTVVGTSVDDPLVQRAKIMLLFTVISV